MKIFNVNPINYKNGDTLTPESFNTNLAAAADANNDILTSRYTRWTNTYQFKNITNASATNERTQNLIKPEYFVAGLNYKYAVTKTVPNAPVGAITLLDVCIRDTGEDMYVLFNDAGRSPSRILQRYRLSTRFDITTATYVAEVPLPTATYGTVNTFTIRGGSSTTTSIFFGTSAAIINTYTLTEVNTSAFTIGTSPNDTLNVSTYFASLKFVRFLRDSASSIPVDYNLNNLGLGLNDGAKLFFSDGSSTSYREAFLVTNWIPSSVSSYVLNTVSTTIKGLSITYPYSSLEADNFGFGGGIYLNTSDVLISSTAPEIISSNEINQKSPLLYTTIQSMYVPPQGLGAYFCADNNKIGYIPFQVPHMSPPQIAIERIIVTAYFTGAFQISFTRFNKDSSLNPDTMYLTGEGNTAETNSAIKWGEFSAKKVILNNYVNNATLMPSFTIGVHTPVSATFNIVKLDVEIHYVSDRLYSPVSSYTEPSADFSPYFLTEINQPDATLVSKVSSEFNRLVNTNVGLNGAVRCGVYRIRNWTSNTDNIRLYKTYPFDNYSGTIVGIVTILETVSGAVVPAATYTANITNDPLLTSRTISSGTNLIEYITCANISASGKISNTTVNVLPDEGTSATHMNLSLTSTVATAMHATVYVLYA